jgi:predicted RND superfamily exporter protein
MTVKQKIKTLFSHPILKSPEFVKLFSIGVIGLFICLTLIGFFNVLNVKTEYNLRQFFPTYHPLLRQDEIVKSRFQGLDAAPFLLVAELKDPDDSWIEKTHLDEIKKLTEELKTIPHVTDIKNLSTLQGAIPSQGGLGIGTVVDYLTPEKLQKELRRNPILSPLFVSRNARILTVFITTDDLSVKEYGDLKAKLTSVGQTHLPSAEVNLGGVPAIQTDVNQILSREVMHFIFIAFFMTLVALSIIFKNHPPILICTITSLFTNILSVWAISIFGFSFSVLSATIPILVTMTVISISLHSILRLIERMEQQKSKDKTYQQIVLNTFRELFRPNLLTALTTSVGFFTLTLSDSPVIKEYGLSVGIALMVTWLNSTTILPAFLLIAPEPKMRHWMKAKARWAFFIMKYHKTVLLTIILVSAFGAWKGQHLSWQAKLFDDLPEDHAVRKTSVLVDQQMGGLVPLDLEINLPNSGESPWSNEEMIENIDLLAKKIRDKKGVGSVLTLSDLLRASGLRTGKKKAAISEILFLMSMSQDNPLTQYLSSDGLSTRISVRLKDIPGSRMWNLVQDIRKTTKEQFPKSKIRMAGIAAYIHDINNALSKDLLYGFWQAMLVIFILLILTYRSVMWSVLACLPNLIPPSLLLGALSLWQIPIKPGIAIILSISLGLAFNNTVYLLERMRHMLLKGHNYQKALLHTFWSEANPCFFSSMVLVVGFAVFAVSYFKMNQQFGVFMVLSVFAGLVGDLVLLPALLQFLLSQSQRWFKLPLNVKTWVLVFALVAGLSPQQSQAANQSTHDELKTLGEKMQSLITTKDESGKIEMTITEKDGFSKKREISYSRLHEKESHFTIMRMIAPKDVKGTALLSVIKNQQEEKWIYLPTSKQTRKISTNDSSARILDSELYTEDFDIGTIQGASSKISKKEKDGTFVIETKMTNPKSSYSKTISWIGNDSLLKKAELYDKKGALLKLIQFPKYTTVGNQKARPVQIQIENVQNKRKTDLVFSNMKVDQKLKEKDFSTRNLGEDF